MTNETTSGNAPPEDLFDLLGEDGEQFKKPGKQKKAEDDGSPAALPNATEGAIKKAGELKVDLAEVKGSGKDGRIVAGDIQKVATERARKESEEKTEAKKKEPETYDKDRIVHYAGHRIEVPTRGMQLEGVRAMLEEQFPELSKERTEMLYDGEKGLVIPVLKGHRKGCARSGGVQPLAVHVSLPGDHDRRPVYHLLGDDGVYEVRKTQVGRFVARVKRERSARSGMLLHVPRVPAALFGEVVDRFRAHPDTEMLANFVFDRRGGYRLVWPEQNGSASHVDAAGEVETEERFIVLQVHSHGKLPAFFSKADDFDEVRTGIYGVVGECDQLMPEAAFRFSVGGNYRRLSVAEVRAQLFDGHPVGAEVLEAGEVEW